MTEIGGSKQPPLKRTAKYETLPLNRSKRQTLLNVVLAYTRVKDLFLRMLGRTVAWHHLDDPRALRASTKGKRPDAVPAHLHDQALFDAVDTLHRPIQSAIANTHLKVKLFARFDGARRHYAFWILRGYARIGAVLRGEAPDPTPPAGAKWKGIAIPFPERKEVVRFVRKPYVGRLASLLAYTIAAASRWIAPCTAFSSITAGSTYRWLRSRRESGVACRCVVRGGYQVTSASCLTRPVEPRRCTCHTTCAFRLSQPLVQRLG